MAEQSEPHKDWSCTLDVRQVVEAWMYTLAEAELVLPVAAVVQACAKAEVATLVAQDGEGLDKP